MSDYPTAKILVDGTRIEYPKGYWEAKHLATPPRAITPKPTRPSPDISMWTEVCGEIPCSCGVYAIQIPSRSGEYITTYIGSSSCLDLRLGKHEVIRELSRVGIEYKILIFITFDYAYLEQISIRKYQPPLNVAHNTSVNKEFVSLFFGRKEKPIKPKR